MSYYLDNKEKMLKQSNEWNKRNPDKVKKYYQDNKERIKLNRKKYYESTKNKYKDHYKNNKELYRNSNKVYCNNHPDKVKERQRWFNIYKKYKLTKKDWENMYIKQCGLCALCHEPFGLEIPNVDHCHTTNVVRGLLHNRCNWVIGVFHESVDKFKLAIEYINSFKSLQR